MTPFLHLIKDRTSVPRSWIVDQISMGTKSYVSRLAGEVRKRLEAAAAERGNRWTRLQD